MRVALPKLYDRFKPKHSLHDPWIDDIDSVAFEESADLAREVVIQHIVAERDGVVHTLPDQLEHVVFVDHVGKRRKFL